MSNVSTEPASHDQQLSRLLFEARELISMQTDTVESRTGKTDDWGRRVVREIDDYRRERGWSPDGFGDPTP
jgi:hypothetical protein